MYPEWVIQAANHIMVAGILGSVAFFLYFAGALAVCCYKKHTKGCNTGECRC